jgi:hypothetical protein
MAAATGNCSCKANQLKRRLSLSSASFFIARRATKIEIANGVMPHTAGAAWMTLVDF